MTLFIFYIFLGVSGLLYYFLSYRNYVPNPLLMRLTQKNLYKNVSNYCTENINKGHGLIIALFKLCACLYSLILSMF